MPGHLQTNRRRAMVFSRNSTNNRARSNPQLEGEESQMSQMPPPPPQPAPMGGTPSAAGSNKKTYTILAYVLGWIGGLIFLFVGKDDPDVKWNAANSVVMFGGLSIVIFIRDLIPVVQLLLFPLVLAGFLYLPLLLFKVPNGQGARPTAPLVAPD